MAENGSAAGHTARFNAYKNKGRDIEDLRRRRVETSVELRKQKKEETLLKRRNVEVSDDEPLSPLKEQNKTLKESSLRNTHTDMFNCESSLLRPASTGTIKLRSRDPFDYPIIDPNYLHKQEDVDLLVRGINLCKRFMSTSYLKKLGAKPADRPNKFCADHKYDSDSYWECMVRQKIHTIYHPAGTCKMGKVGDPTAVVDPQLRVIGVQGLRVVDTSIMPDIVSGNTHTPVVMIGEKAAHLIRGR
uniref:IBB domain-containing protein n=1 Tax=Arion vulgaris TaxID=1028688 RepID=A0A0B7BD54_9EUPU